MNENHVIDGWLAQLRFDSLPARRSAGDRDAAVPQAAWGSSGSGLSAGAGASTSGALAAAS
jgi:hypothetical protein